MIGKEGRNMRNSLYDYGFGTLWTERLVYRKEGRSTSVADLHEHDFYEINLILSGNFRILLADQVREDTECCVLVAKPGTSHFVSCKPDRLYSRLYLVFTHEFLADFSLEAKLLLSSFSETGTIISLNDEQKELCVALMTRIEAEHDRLRERLLILYLLSVLSDLDQKNQTALTGVPAYILQALSYIDGHFREKITAEQLAKKINVGRTTLMTGFKRYTGSTLNDYLVHRRLRVAIQLMQDGKTVQEAAEWSGFGDSSSLIRSFKKQFGMTPRQYILSGATP